MDNLYTHHFSQFSRVYPKLIKNKEPLATYRNPASRNQAAPANEITAHYLYLDGPYENRVIMRYPCLKWGADSRYHVGATRGGEIVCVLVRKLCAPSPDKPANASGATSKTRYEDYVAPSPAQRGNLITRINKVPNFLNEEAKILLSSSYFKPSSTLFSCNKDGRPKKAYIVFPLHGRTLGDISNDLLLSFDAEADAQADAEGNSPAEYEGDRVFARNLCWQVWCNLKELFQKNVCHFDLKLNNIFVRFDSLRGLECPEQGPEPGKPTAKDPEFILGDYGHAVKSGLPADIFQSTINKSFESIFSTTDRPQADEFKMVLGTVRLAHPQVFLHDGRIYSPTHLPQVDQRNFAPNHLHDRFSAGYMILSTVQPFLQDDDDNPLGDKCVDELHLTLDHQVPDGQQVDALPPDKRRYQANVDVFRMALHGMQPTGVEALAYCERWSTIFRALARLDSDVELFVRELLKSVDFDEDQYVDAGAYDFENAPRLRDRDRALLRRALRQIPLLDDATLSHSRSLHQHRQELFKLADDIHREKSKVPR